MSRSTVKTHRGHAYARLGACPPLALSRAQVLSWRLDRHLLERPEGTGTEDVVRRLAGVQAQVAAAAEQAVAVRRADAHGGVAEAVAARTLVRTWAMRGTLHVLDTADTPAFLALLAAARTWEKGSWQRTFATAAQMAAIAEVAADALDGAALTREELAAAALAHTDDPTLVEKLHSGWVALLKPLAWQGLLCHADGSGNRVTFTSHPEAGAAPLVRGPDEAGVLAQVTVDGEPAYARASDLDSLAAAVPTDPHVVPPARRALVSRAGDGSRPWSPTAVRWWARGRSTTARSRSHCSQRRVRSIRTRSRWK